MDWHDVRLFLEVGRTGNLREAAARLGIHHTTLARRVRALEQKLNTRLLEKAGKGVGLTSAGAELVREGEQIFERMANIERRIAGQDTALAGHLTITMPDVVLTHLLSGAVATFARENLGISLNVRTTNEVLDLGSRDADISIRSSAAPDENLVGRRMSRKAFCAYVRRDDVSSRGQLNGRLIDLRWAVNAYGGRARREISANGDLTLNMVQAHLALVNEGGMRALLPCFVGDREAELVRAPGEEHFYHQDVWLLTHRDLKNAAKVRAFLDVAAAALEKHRDLIEGREPAAN